MAAQVSKALTLISLKSVTATQAKSAIGPYKEKTFSQKVKHWLEEQSILSPFAWITGHSSLPPSAGQDLAKGLTYFTPGIGIGKAITESSLGIISGNANSGDYINLGLAVIPYFLKYSAASNNFVYRAIRSDEALSIQAGKGITAKNPTGSWTLEEHLIGGSSPKSLANDPWISTTTDLEIAKSFNSGSGIIRINLNKVPSSSEIQIGF